MTKVSRLLRLHEGTEASAYQDSLGYWTIGVGRLIDKRKGGRLSQDEIDYLLQNDIKEKQAHLLSVCPWASTLDEVRFAVLLDMTFNLGSLQGWPIFREQVRVGNYEAAAANMLGTKWATQVKTRAERLAKMLVSGTWPTELTT